MTNLNRMLGRLFTPPPARKPDPHRKDRVEAKRLATEIGVEIEKLRGGGWNVWPPKALMDQPGDPFGGDHYCGDWAEVYVAVQTYRDRRV